HVYGLTSAGVAFAALVVAVLACLLLADHLRLRWMAGLAGIAACATPVLTSTGEGQLGELMIYQTCVLAAFAVLDVRRGWPELPTLGLLGTWALLMGWGASHLDATTSVPFMASVGVLVLAGAASTWRVALQVANARETGLAVARVLAGGLSAWAAAGWAFGDHLPSLRMATLLLAAWHLAFGVFVARRNEALHRATLGLGWFMACTGGFMVGGMAAILGWWTLMATAIALVWSGRTQYLPWMLLPAMCAGGYALVLAEQPWAMGTGAVTAIFLVAVGLWPSRGAPPQSAFVLLGVLLHAALVYVAGPDTMHGRYMVGLPPFALIMARGALEPATGFPVAAKALFVAFGASVLMFGPTDVAGPEFVGILALAVAGTVLLIRARQVHGKTDAYEGTGLLLSGYAGLLMVRALCGAFPDHGSVLMTVVLAAVGLGLVIAGLRLEHKLWRHVGLTGICVGAAKLAVVDTASAALPVRGLSFIALGGILILGAYAYRRAAQRDKGLAC
ncbi:MAG: DUF2339 domain-containing protein, partial [Nannocystaceae bacterium]|nr:DUF2339 domain-containing protein [Nannocystaceae bacterium]